MSGFGERFGSYRASKGMLFGCCAATAIATMIVGFTWGGWVTGGSAEERAELASEIAVAELAAGICFNRFMASPNARTELVALKEESSYRRDDMLADGGWTTFAGREGPVEGAGEICADLLAEAELPEEGPVAAVDAQLVATPEPVIN